MAMFLLFEAASGYGLLECIEAEEVASQSKKVLDSVNDVSKFSKIVKLNAFQAFESAEDALQNINDVSEGIVNESLKNFLEMNLPKVKPGKKAKFSIGVVEPKIGTAIQEALGVTCVVNETIFGLLRGARQHLATLVKGLEGGAMERAQLGLAHSYSRAKVKFNVNRSDNMIIQAICLLDQMDKDLNTFSMRIKEWYGWHFPELAKIVKDNYMYARVAQFIGRRSTLTEEKLPELTKLTLDEDLTKAVYAASRSSMGMDCSEVDIINVDAFTHRVVALAEYRSELHNYLIERMHGVAPNLSALIGEQVGARLISHAGSLTNLAKAPASTIQILGAEKALFRALKTKGNTPKYGLIFHSTFIGRAGAKNKGRISRYLANKCAIASRVDSFADFTTSKFGEKMRDQVEERLSFYETGAAPKRNVDAMKEVLAEVAPLMAKASAEAAATTRGAAVADDAAPKSAKKAKKEKKVKSEKKSKKRSRDEDESGDEAGAAAAAAAADSDSSDAKVESSAKKARKSDKKDKKDKKVKSEKKSKKEKKAKKA